MVSPERQRQAVLHLQEHCEASECRACKVTRQPRATQRYRGRRWDKDAPLVAALWRVSRRRPRAGYRMVAAHLRRDGWEVNTKRVQRLWREKGLKVPRRQGKRRRLGHSDNAASRRRATRINQVWSDYFVFDQTEDGRWLKGLPICDEFSRESVALWKWLARWKPKTCLRSWIVPWRSAAHLSLSGSDNGPEFLAAAVQEWIKERGLPPSTNLS